LAASVVERECDRGRAPPARKSRYGKVVTAYNNPLSLLDHDVTMRNSTKERLELLPGAAFFGGLGALALYQVYRAATGEVILSLDGALGATRWITYDTNPFAFVWSLAFYSLLVLLGGAAIFVALFNHRFKNRWRSRNFIDYAIRRAPDQETHTNDARH
jgi:hypothetical protein